MNSSLLLKKWTLAVAAAAFFSAAAFSQEMPKNADPNKGLKDYYKDYFPLGVAVNIAALHGADSGLIVKEFNSVTPENDMKKGPLHPSEDVYNWKNADAIVDFATSNKIKIRTPTLGWHNQEA